MLSDSDIAYSELLHNSADGRGGTAVRFICTYSYTVI